ncbi:unnamed protein product [Leptosia nina]|uniref:Uncharacterized protein n=1 Tax=Leptosia nina TaxID=320188 RepID=A0AAV1JYN3_9NEOP
MSKDNFHNCDSSCSSSDSDESWYRKQIKRVHNIMIMISKIGAAVEQEEDTGLDRLVKERDSNSGDADDEASDADVAQKRPCRTRGVRTKAIRRRKKPMNRQKGRKEKK